MEGKAFERPFDVLVAARPVYRLLGVTGMPDDLKRPEPGKLVGDELCYFVDGSVNLVRLAQIIDIVDRPDLKFPRFDPGLPGPRHGQLPLP